MCNNSGWNLGKSPKGLKMVTCMEVYKVYTSSRKYTEHEENKYYSDISIHE